MLKSAMASPTWRRMRLASLSVSSFAFRGSVTVKRRKETILEKYRTTAVNGQHLAGDERRGGEEVYRLRDLLGPAEARERRGGDDAPALRRRKLAVLGPGDRARRHRVDAHRRPELERQRARHRRKARLGDAVDRVALQ